MKEQEIVRALAAAGEQEQSAVLATVVEVEGASPAKVGMQVLILQNGDRIGTVGGGHLEEAVLMHANQVLRDGRPRLEHYALNEEGEDAVGMLCGGELRVFFQPYLPSPQLVIVGGGHIGQPLKVMGEAAGFRVQVVDVEPGRATVPELDAISFDEQTYVVLISADHITDEAALRKVIRTPVPYIGMIGSLNKCKTVRQHLLEDGYGEAALGRLFAPIGLDLGGPTPGEIAVAILAEIIALRRKADPEAGGIPFRRNARLAPVDAGKENRP